MNAERLYVIAKAIKTDLAKGKIIPTLEQLINALQNQITAPQEPSHQQQVSEYRTKLNEALTESSVRDFSPTWMQIVDQIHGTHILGEKLLESLEQCFSANAITPSVALDKLKVIRDELKAFSNGLDQLINAYAQLSIGSEDLEPGECEVGILIPRGFVDDRLDNLGKELAELNKIFGVFAEIAQGGRPGFKVRTLSTSDFLVFIEAALPVAACIAVAVDKLISTYKNLLDIRKHHRELKELGLRKVELGGIEEYANRLMSERIDELDKELLAEFLKQADQHRENELKVELKQQLSKLANRIDRGFNVEVRCMPLLEQGDDALDETDSDRQEQSKRFEMIKATQGTLQFLRLEGEPLLSLPESASKPQLEREKPVDVAKGQKSRARRARKKTPNDEDK